MSLPEDYPERVYAGVLGKMIGVYLGRPVEGWTYQQITDRFGEIRGYVHAHLDLPLVVPDDDLSGTFTFIRALEDYGYSTDLAPAQIGHSWLNYLIEEKTVLWWGGMGNSTEHTAYLRLKTGIDAPQSGSTALNGKTVSEQIGAQIFIDSWGMVAPGQPELAADLARRAASVSHDEEAVYAAQVIAAMEALAFVERDLDALLDAGVALVPQGSVIAQMIAAIRGWHAAEPDWRAARRRLAAAYGTDRFGGNVHVVPNHGLIVLALLYGAGDFRESLAIVTTSGWDTDCNAGNLGCLLGIRNGPAGFEGGPDWRGPVADRLYLPTADPGRAITDAVTETYHLVNTARRFQELPPLAPKNGARFHFELPGSVQGFRAIPDDPETGIRVENVAGHSRAGSRSLGVHIAGRTPGGTVRIEAATFHPSREIYEYFAAGSYPLLASPTIYPGQLLRLGISAGRNNPGPVEVRPAIRRYDQEDDLSSVTGDPADLQPGEYAELAWRVPDLGGYPIAFAGLQVGPMAPGPATIYLDYLAWDGTPHFRLQRPYDPDTPGPHPVMWKRAWVNGLDSGDGTFEWDHWPESFRLVQNAGRGLLITGTREWTDYRAEALITPHMCRAGGLAVRVQGMRRYYALRLDGAATRLIRAFEGRDEVLAEAPTGWEMGRAYRIALQAAGSRLVGMVDDAVVLEAEDPEGMFSGGGIALFVEEGRIGCEEVRIGPEKR